MRVAPRGVGLGIGVADQAALQDHLARRLKQCGVRAVKDHVQPIANFIAVGAASRDGFDHAFDHAADVFGRYLARIGRASTDAGAGLLDFLGRDEPDEDAFAQDGRIVPASAEFSRELTTSVLWLIERDIDIRCVRTQPYDLDGRVLVDVQQIIPLPEVAAGRAGPNLTLSYLSI